MDSERQTQTKLEDIELSSIGLTAVPSESNEGTEPVVVAAGDRYQKHRVSDPTRSSPGSFVHNIGKGIGVVDELNLTIWREALLRRLKTYDLGISVKNSCSCLTDLKNRLVGGKSRSEPPRSEKADLPNSAYYAYGTDGLRFYKYLARVEARAPHDAMNRPILSFRPKQLADIGKDLFLLDSELTEEEREVINYKMSRKVEPRRSRFPWFLTIFSVVQILAVIVLLAMYGFGDIGLYPQVTIIQDVVTIRGIEQVDKWTRPNLWLGPPLAGLIKAGAVYGPCLRTDSTVKVILLSSMYRQGQSLGCCVVSKHSIAATLTQNECDRGTQGGGQWNDGSCNASLMVEVKQLLRPCCYGLLGNCKMTTETGCEVQKGTFHKDKKHCSEVFCFPSFCSGLGMKASKSTPFIPATANQGWRFLVSMIYLAGILHAVLLLFFQWTVGKPIESMVGWLRMTLVYIYASFGGNLLAAFMDPYSPHVGVGGGLTCIVVIAIVEVAQLRKQLAGRFKMELGLLVALLVYIFISGFAPLLNNFAHLGGILFGLPLAYLLMPHLNFNKWNCRARKMIVIVSALVVLVTLLVFLLLFYLIQDVGFCTKCYYFSCIPFTDHMCNVLVELIGTVSVD